MKTKLFLILIVASVTAWAQTNVEKTIPIKPGQKFSIDFDYPEVKIQTWDKNEILVKGTVSINHGENDGAFELQTSQTDNTVSLTSILKDKEKIPQRITIRKGDQEYYFKAKDYNDPEIVKFLEENGHDYAYMSNGIQRDIKLEIFVPKNIETMIMTKYGTVEVPTFNGPLSVDAKYGKVDAVIVAQAVGEITAKTRHGEILTNVSFEFDQNGSNSFTRHRGDSWTEISARPGKGPKYSFVSKYGNIYLRKP